MRNLMRPDEIDRLADEIAIAAAHIDAASHALLTLIRRFDEEKGWARQGARSCAHWLGWRIGLGPGAAREHVRVARRLGELRHIDDALRRGELSYAKVRAMTRVATAESEARLVSMARSATGAALERICRGYRQAQALGSRAEAVAARSVRQRSTETGLVRIEAELLPDEAALVMAALRQTRDRLREERKRLPGVSAETPPASLADALVAVAEASLTAAEPEARPAGRSHELVVVLREERLAEGGWHAELADGSAIPGATLRRLACDAGVTVARSDADGTPLDVGRKRRTVPPALARALRLRDGGCRFPGCTHRAFVDAHHIRHWADGGATSLENTCLLCHLHHTALHEGGYRLERTATGELVFFTPDGRPLAPSPAPPPIGTEDALARLARDAAARGIHIDHRTSLIDWSGAPLDLHAAVSALTRPATTLHPQP
jgi:hypothetical protein